MEKKQTAGVEDLASRIENAQGMLVENDPRVCEARKRIEEFQGKAAAARARVEQLKEDLVQKEKEIGDQVLKGGPTSIADLTRLRQKMVEAESEASIFATVVQQTETVATELTEEVSGEYQERNWGLLIAAIEELNAALQTAFARVKVVHAARALRPNESWITESLHRLERTAGQLQAQQEHLERVLASVKKAGDPATPAEHG